MYNSAYILCKLIPAELKKSINITILKRMMLGFCDCHNTVARERLTGVKIGSKF